MPLKKHFHAAILLTQAIALLAPLHCSPPSKDWETYQSAILKEQPEFAGWCPLKKAKEIMEIIVAHRSELCVELGVFGGSSFFPIAAALAFTGQGIAYAIDPWSNAACLEGYAESDQKHNAYWGTVDLEKVMDKFTARMHKNHLTPYYRTLRLSSAEALSHFKNGSIDFLHIDGNHSQESALFDVENWLPKVKPGGIICFDDAWWNSTQPAVNLLLQECTILEESSSTWRQYIFLQKKLDNRRN